MVKITLVSLLHSLSDRFPVYPVALLLSQLDEHQGEVWLPTRSGADIKQLRQHGKGQGAQELASLEAGWSPVTADQGDASAGLAALADYDAELLDNLQLYWHCAAKINSPITDNLFELRREVVDEAHGAALAQAWQRQQQVRLEQVLAAARRGQDQLCFVEVESAYWLRQQLSETAGVTLVIPDF